MPYYDPPEFPCNSSQLPVKTELTPEQQVKYIIVLEWLKEQILFPTTENDIDFDNKKGICEGEPLNDEEKAWLSKECILRYCRASKWNVKDTKKRLILSIGWRREFGILSNRSNTITEDIVSVENETAKQLLFGFDNYCRPCLGLRNGCQNTEASFRQIQHLIFMLERAIDFMPPGQEQVALLIDFKAYTTLGKRVPSISTGRQVLHILHAHYPERLGKALLTNMPWFAWTFMKIIHPFIDPVTREKLVFTKPYTDFVPLEHLFSEYGGKVDFEYIHEKYWPKLISMAKEKHECYMAQWERLGGGIGLSEWDMRKPYNEKDDLILND